MTTLSAILSYTKDFLEVYKNQPTFSYMFHGDYSHDSRTQVKLADGEMKAFLEKRKPDLR